MHTSVVVKASKTNFNSTQKPKLGPVNMRKNTSLARPGAERRGKFQPPFI